MHQYKFTIWKETKIRHESGYKNDCKNRRAYKLLEYHYNKSLA